MSVTEVEGLPDGTPVWRVELGRAPGVVLRLLTLGATVQDLEVTGGDGVRRHVVLGHARAADYLASTAYLGGTIGRCANRIRAGHLPLPDGDHLLPTNDRGNHLHGGPGGFDKRGWDLVSASDDRATLRLLSPDGDQGYPGTVVATVTFRVDADAVAIDLTATTDRTTVVNLTQHAYWNLEGRASGPVDDHLLQVPAERYTPIDDTGLPLGDHADVAGTPFDLRDATRIGVSTGHDHPQVRAAQGLDHNLVVDAGPRGPGTMRPVCRLDSPASATRLEVSSDQPGLQVYTGNHLAGIPPSADGTPFRRGDGVALEPQLYPDSPHHDDWPSVVLEPGQEYRSRIGWSFSRLG